MPVTLALESKRSAKLYPISQLPPAVEVQLATHDGATGHHGPIKDLLPNLVRWADRAYAVGSTNLYHTLSTITKETRFGLQPDFLYGLAIAWLCARLRPAYETMAAAALRVGIAVSLTGGITTYFAIANSGFIPWRLALASFVLVLVTKIPLALQAGRWLDK